VTFELEVGGRTRHVEARGREIFLDEQPIDMDAARVGHAWSLLIGPAEAGPHDPAVGAGFVGSPKLRRSEGCSRPMRSYEVAVVEHAAGGLTVHVNGRPVAVRASQVGHGGRRTRRGARIEGPRHGPQRVVAPMPGRIAKVLVKAGDVVAARQGLVVVEAMKMENELRSPQAGTVTEVRAVEGALVEANAVLVVVE
jgi:biotin carboxyl carrier protein